MMKKMNDTVAMATFTLLVCCLCVFTTACLRDDANNDANNDANCLIDISTWEDLSKVRDALDHACGYELAKSLDFCNPEDFRAIDDKSLEICDEVSKDLGTTETSDDITVQGPNANHPYYNEGKGWDPIGSMETPFQTVFEGNDFEIKNLYVSDYQYSGLFTSASGAEFRKLSLVNLYVSSYNPASPTGHSSSGGLVGNVSGGDVSITKISVSGEGAVFSTSQSGGTFISSSGALVGNVSGGDVSITDSSSVDLAVFSSHKGLSQASHSGGLVGNVSGGDVSITGSSVGGGVRSLNASAGGLVGAIVGKENTDIIGITITDSHVSGGVQSVAASGGLVGHIHRVAKREIRVAITNSSMRNTVSAFHLANARSGGLVGFVEGSTDTFITITNSYVNGDVLVGTNSGGLVGSVNGVLTIRNSYMSGDVSAHRNSTFIGGAVSGGLVGDLSASGTLTIRNSYVSGEVSSAGSAVTAPVAGGLLGGNSLDASLLTIEDAYYHLPNSSTLKVVGIGNHNLTDADHSRTEAQLKAASLDNALGISLGNAFYFADSEYPRLRRAFPGADGVFGPNPGNSDVNDDTYGEEDELL